MNTAPIADMPEERRGRQVAYNWGWLRLSYGFADALVAKAWQGRTEKPLINVTGDPSAAFLIRIQNESKVITSARWENKGLSVSKPYGASTYFDTIFDGQTLEFKDKTVDQVASEVLEFAMKKNGD